MDVAEPVAERQHAAIADPDGPETAVKITDSPTQLQFPTSRSEDVVTSAINADAPIRFSCRDGFCGQCRGEVLAGRYRAGRDGALREVPPGGAPEPVFLCQTYPQSDLAIRMPRAGDASSTVRAARIEAVACVAADIAVVRLALLDGGAPLAWRAGQFVAIRWGVNGYKPFSLARACGDGRELELHVRRVAGGDFTEWLFADAGRAAAGAIVGLEGPLGDFGWGSPAGRPVLLVATGTGFAPLAAMIEAERLDARATPVHLYVGGRGAADLHADARCRAWSAANPSFRYVPVLSDGAAGGAVDEARVGHVQEAVLDDFASLAGFDVYACGAPAMIDAARARFVGERGLDPARFFADPFALPARPASAAGAVRDTLIPLNLQLPDGRRGQLMAVAGRRLLGELMRNGIALPHLCGGQTVCATCAVSVEPCADRAGEGIEAAGEAEADLLDFLGAAPATRLACQLRLAQGHAHAEIRLPRATPAGQGMNEPNGKETQP